MLAVATSSLASRDPFHTDHERDACQQGARLGAGPGLIVILQLRVAVERVLVKDAAGIGRLDE